MQQEHYYHGVGRRKSAIAQVRLYTQPGGIVINGKPLEEAFPWEGWQDVIREPLKVADALDKYSVQVKVIGGGVVGQAGAVRHGIARALVVLDESLRAPLRKRGLLTRDARVKESKKYGLKRARAKEQYSKR
ncbi:MAG: 30S ribosomal protein S9 [Chloroflexi bacterium]|nr:30S ribosomal protein S9 [Chloroflexota bacterium]MBI4198762.1 30S ribosomal protein S9 [Chloroflexota bacterium]